MTSRGIRGATTVEKNTAEDMVQTTKTLLAEMIEKNNVQPESVSHVFISATQDLNAVFPARALREFPGWTCVPVMCMAEMDVVNGLQSCIRVMMVVNSDEKQENIHHIYHNEAVKLRPDLAAMKGE